MLDFLLKLSDVARSLEPPVSLNELLRCYCETPKKFAYIVGLLERLPQFAGEKLKLSNCVIRGDLPYDSLVGLAKDDLSELWKVMDYLDFPNSLMEKLELLIENMISYEKYLIEYRLFDPKDTLHWSYIGDLEGLKYAHAQGYLWDERTCEIASQRGHLECLKYAHTQGCPWDRSTSSCAAQNGHLECLKYAHEQDCPWGRWTCAYAARNGHLECLKYAHEHGCPWNRSTISCAAQNGHLECLKYAQEHGCPE